jgi:type III pantothenate kinase
LEEVQRSLDPSLSILITGGDAPTLVPRLKSKVTEVPDLVLRGLARVAESL